jgi:hypothetical protein
MFEVMALATLGVAAVMFALALVCVLLVVKLVAWLVFWPLRILGSLLMLPLAFVAGLVGLALVLALLPLLLLGAFIVGALVLVPLVPLLLLGLFLWLLVALVRKPAAAH